MRVIAAALSVLLAGCSAWPPGSYIEKVSDADAAVLASAIANYVAGALPTRTSISLVSARPDDPIARLVGPEMDREGFTLTSTGEHIRYLAAPLDAGLLLRVSINDRQGACRYFARGADGTIRPGGPLMVSSQ